MAVAEPAIPACRAAYSGDLRVPML
jgi:hypothetical protein